MLKMFCDKQRNLATLRVCPVLPGYGSASVSQSIELRASCDMKLTVVLFGYRTSVSLLSTLIAAQVILKKNPLKKRFKCRIVHPHLVTNSLAPLFA